MKLAGEVDRTLPRVRKSFEDNISNVHRKIIFYNVVKKIECAGRKFQGNLKCSKFLYNFLNISGVAIMLSITIFATIVGEMLPVSDATPLIGGSVRKTSKI